MNNRIKKTAKIIFIIVATFTFSTTIENVLTIDAANPKSSNKSVYVSKIKNNGKILSDKGLNSIKSADIINISISNDTVFFELKKECLSRLDKDRTNYIGNKTKNTKQK